VRSPKRILASSVLCFEAPCVFFGGLVAKDLTDLSTAAAVGGASAIAVLCLLVAGLLGRPGGYALGSILQVVILATGFVVPAMFVVGVLFGALWVTALVQGGRLERSAAGYADPSDPVPQEEP
jgi:hypothetical protein